MEFKVNILSKGDAIEIVTGTGDAWGAYIRATEGSSASNVGAFTDTSYFDITVYDDSFSNETRFLASHSLRFSVDEENVDALILNLDGTIQLPEYGAGVLTSDASGNITAEAGGSGISKEEAIAYAVALG